jgi:alkanesulfonate monooxygenase SsuD/methylene tetrahydromethanopterin reductase-like flavin-dependent oxidoreductase (luciferase family)
MARLKPDRLGRTYTTPGAVRSVRHQGRHDQVEGVNLTEPSRQRTPVLYQAGTSDRGLRFAARHAEAVFLSGNNRDIVRESVLLLRRAAVEAGRRSDDIKIILGVTVVPGRTEAGARDEDADYRRHASPEAGLAHCAASTGIDFSCFDLDEPITYGRTESIQSAVATARRLGWTRCRLLEQYALGGRYPAIVGDAVQVADVLQAWADDTGVDGFNLTRTVVPESFEDFIASVVPGLQQRGLHKTAYTEGSLRHKLFGQPDRLPARHAAAACRDLAWAPLRAAPRQPARQPGRIDPGLADPAHRRVRRRACRRPARRRGRLRAR